MVDLADISLVDISMVLVIIGEHDNVIHFFRNSRPKPELLRYVVTKGDSITLRWDKFDSRKC